MWTWENVNGEVGGWAGIGLPCKAVEWNLRGEAKHRASLLLSRDGNKSQGPGVGFPPTKVVNDSEMCKTSPSQCQEAGPSRVGFVWRRQTRDVCISITWHNSLGETKTVAGLGMGLPFKVAGLWPIYPSSGKSPVEDAMNSGRRKSHIFFLFHPSLFSLVHLYFRLCDSSFQCEKERDICTMSGCNF